MSQPSKEEIEINQFGNAIMQWSEDHPRPLPWKSFSDPYHIWIAEIILQQTRVDQGTPYFEKFIEHFPDLGTLAKASVEDVLVVWEGLGYYSRARNLHHTARQVYYEMDGRFPDNSTGLQSLKGIGPYTAAAIASFAFGEQIGVVDGNVKRVISRYFDMSDEIGLPATHRKIQRLVNQVVRHYPSAGFNQAIMNFGALMCVPRQPDCTRCPANTFCKAYQLDIVEDLPFKKKSQKKQKRWLYFGIYEKDGQIAMIQNNQSNIWKNLFLFPIIGEKPGFKSSVESHSRRSTPDLPLLGEMEWILSHRRLFIHFYRLDNRPSEWDQKQDIIMVESDKIENFAIPRPLRLFLNKNSRKLGSNLNYDQ